MGSRKLEGKRLTDNGLQELKLDQLFRTHINVVRGTFAGRISKDAETYFALFGAYRSFSMLAHPGRDATTSSQGVKSSEKREKARKKFLRLC
jgi:hypothetical protein